VAELGTIFLTFCQLSLRSDNRGVPGEKRAPSLLTPPSLVQMPVSYTCPRPLLPQGGAWLSSSEVLLRQSARPGIPHFELEIFPNISLCNLPSSSRICVWIFFVPPRLKPLLQPFFISPSGRELMVRIQMDPLGPQAIFSYQISSPMQDIYPEKGYLSCRIGKSGPDFLSPPKLLTFLGLGFLFEREIQGPSMIEYHSPAFEPHRPPECFHSVSGDVTVEIPRRCDSPSFFQIFKYFHESLPPPPIILVPPPWFPHTAVRLSENTLKSLPHFFITAGDYHKYGHPLPSVLKVN